MKKQIFLLLIFVASLPFSSAGQILNKIKNAAERGVSKAVEKKVESEVEKATQKQLEKTFSGIYGSEGMPGMEMDKILSGIHADVPIADRYDFTGHSTMLITGQDEKGKPIEPLNLKLFFPESELVMGMEIEIKEKGKREGISVIIYDLERSASILLFDHEGQKSRVAYGYDFKEMSEGKDIPSSEAITEEIKFVKTGRNKTILGYNCEEFQVEDEEGIASYWITEKLIGGKSSLWNNSNPALASRIKKQNTQKINHLPTGSMLEFDYKSKKDKSEVLMTVTEINETARQTFLMSDYQNAFTSVQ